MGLMRPSLVQRGIDVAHGPDRTVTIADSHLVHREALVLTKFCLFIRACTRAYSSNAAFGMAIFFGAFPGWACRMDIREQVLLSTLSSSPIYRRGRGARARE